MTRPLRTRGLLSPIWPRSALIVPLLVLSLAHAQGAAAQERYEDGTFDIDGDGVLTGWSLYGPFFTPQDAVGAGVGTEAPRSGGNPGAFLRSHVTSVSVPSGESWLVWGIFINDQAVYDPSALGAIERVDFDFDGRVPASEAGGSRAVSLALQQDGFLWAAVGPRVFVQGQSWTPISISGLQDSDFITLAEWGEEEQPATPDFSENGSPISFGLLQGQSCPATSDCSAPPREIKVDVDNWTVTVNDTGLRVRLDVDPVAALGQLPGLPLELAVSASVRNSGSVDVTDVDVRFLLPNEALADSSVPEAECVTDSMSMSDAVVADCTVDGPIGPGDVDTVRVPAGMTIAMGYDDTVPDGSELTFRAEIVSFSGREPDSGDVLQDEVVISICNPLGMDPFVVDDVTACADLPTGGTSGAGGSAGAGGNPGGSDGAGDCECRTATAGDPAPWLVPLLCLVAFAIRRRLRH